VHAAGDTPDDARAGPGHATGQDPTNRFSSIWISAAAAPPREFRARFRSLYDVGEEFFRMKELSMRPTKTCFISDDRIDAVLIGTSIALIILLVIVAV
jgi:hypothetical protein